MTSTLSAVEERVLVALATVRDPELDEPITALGFVASCTVADDGHAEVRLRLPTYFCAANFAFLMVADAFDVVSATEGVTSVDVELLDHFAGEQINAGVAARAGFVKSFDGEAVAELDELRADFIRKAVMAGTYLVSRPLLAQGRTESELAALTMGEVPESADLARLRRRRAELGIPTGADAPLVIDPVTGGAVEVAALPLHLRRARLHKVGIDANTGICRGMLAHRYPEANEQS
ncbi:MAG TPA: iron-sulfur cluster assembly protein [Pseudonocardiaceae bacterium]|jgi:metal-sulfur cluster biosynthetic enzyme